MNHSFLIAVGGGLGGMLGWGFADFCAKKTVDQVGEVASLVWAHLMGAVLFVLIALYQLAVTGIGLRMPSTHGAWVGLIFFGVLQMIVYWLLYKGFSKGQLAVLNPVFAAFPGLVAIMSIAFFGEHLTAKLAISLIVIFAGIMLINSDLETLKQKRLKVLPGLKEVGAAALLAAIWTMGWGKFVAGQDALTYAMFMYIFMAAAAIVLSRFVKANLLDVKPYIWKYLFFIGLGEVIAYLSITLGYSKTHHISVVALVSGSFSVPAIALAYAFLQERISKLQAGAIVVILVGIGLAALS